MRTDVKTANVKFQVGATYTLRTYSDGDEYAALYTVKSRTASFVTLERDGKVARFGTYAWDGVERCRPWGSYSMAPVLTADSKVG